MSGVKRRERQKKKEKIRGEEGKYVKRGVQTNKNIWEKGKSRGTV